MGVYLLGVPTFRSQGLGVGDGWYLRPSSPQGCWISMSLGPCSPQILYLSSGEADLSKTFFSQNSVAKCRHSAQNQKAQHQGILLETCVSALPNFGHLGRCGREPPHVGDE